MTGRNRRPRRPKVTRTAVLDALGVYRPGPEREPLLEDLGVQRPGMSDEDRKALAEQVVDEYEGLGRAQ